MIRCKVCTEEMLIIPGSNYIGSELSVYCLCRKYMYSSWVEHFIFDDFVLEKSNHNNIINRITVVFGATFNTCFSMLSDYANYLNKIKSNSNLKVIYLNEKEIEIIKDWTYKEIKNKVELFLLYR